MPIDRRAVVSRHNPHLTQWDRLSPLSVGNGEFAFTADVTGLQTFADAHERSAARGGDGANVMPLGTQAQWAYHWSPNPRQWTLEQTEKTLAGPRGEFPYPVDYDFLLDGDQSAAAGMAPGYYYWTNPQRLHLGRISLALPARADGGPTRPDNLTEIDQELDLWTGQLRSSFVVNGGRVLVTTICHPREDLLAVRIHSPAVGTGELGVQLDFPSVAPTFEAEPDWNDPGAHTTEVPADLAGRAAINRLTRRIDEARYEVALSSSPGREFVRHGPHRFRTAGGQTSGDTLDVVIAFSKEPRNTELPSFDEVEDASTRGWADWWSSGAAVDFAEATDPRAAELERRVVLSQYLTAINCAGSTPPQETGLVCNSWAGKFHLEMHWWHAAHFAAWGRPQMLERSLSWYQRLLPTARRTAQSHGLQGAQWPKHIGPEGVESPNLIGPLLVWQQPHPIHFAELVRAASPDDPEVIARYGELVDETARCLVSMLVWDDDDAPHLPPPLVPAQEVYEPETVWDPLFEMAYLRWGLETANTWRVARGLPREAEWDVAAELIVAPVSAVGGYDAVQNPPRTSLRDHPSMTGALGVVPATGAIDPDAMRATLDRVMDGWEWSSAWGWDFPMLALCATRLGDAAGAFDFLLRDAGKNRYLTNGHNFQDDRLPLYLPGNGGLLVATALLAGGWVSADGDRVSPPVAPGWEMKAEGFPPRP